MTYTTDSIQFEPQSGFEKKNLDFNVKRIIDEVPRGPFKMNTFYTMRAVKVSFLLALHFCGARVISCLLFFSVQCRQVLKMEINYIIILTIAV